MLSSFLSSLGYYLLWPLIQIVSRSPFKLLYIYSDILSFLLYNVFGYRKKVVIDNLRRSFPEKSEKEILKDVKAYYQHLCDLILETFKTISWKEEDVRKKTTFINPEIIDHFYEQKKSVILVMGHLGNWEWAGPCFSLNCKHQLNVVYLPLSNIHFEKLLTKTRTKFNTLITPKNNTLRAIIANRKILTATALIADQAPAPIHTAHWMKFLNQDTPVFRGPAKIAQKMNYPLIYICIKKTKRGHYEVIPEVLAENPNDFSETALTEMFNKKLEKDIYKMPVTWLWSHKRWKHKRP